MDKVFPKQVYSGLFEIIKDNRLYYHSKVGDNYCHLTEEGEKAVLAWVKLVAPEMHRLNQAVIDSRAKEMVWEELKK